MGSISQRLARLEEHIGEAACVCSGEGSEITCIVIESDLGAVAETPPPWPRCDT
jgi:hypothetical protein